MLIHIVGGFLGSGKTTLLMQIAKWYMSHEKTVVILENEFGEIGVDATTIGSSGLNAIELKNGCICCSLSGTLQATVGSIEKELHPDILIIEPTGLALPHKVMSIIRGTVDDEGMSIIGVCDAQRFLALKERKEEFLRMQLAKSDVIWINKIDSASFEEVFEASSWLRKICPGTPLYMVSGKTGEGIDDAISSPVFRQD